MTLFAKNPDWFVKRGHLAAHRSAQGRNTLDAASQMSRPVVSV